MFDLDLLGSTKSPQLMPSKTSGKYHQDPESTVFHHNYLYPITYSSTFTAITHSCLIVNLLHSCYLRFKLVCINSQCNACPNWKNGQLLKAELANVCQFSFMNKDFFKKNCDLGRYFHFMQKEIWVTFGAFFINECLHFMK